VKSENAGDQTSGPMMIQSKCDEASGRLPARALFWD
jgi:hypothetical protein